MVYNTRMSIVLLSLLGLASLHAENYYERLARLREEGFQQKLVKEQDRRVIQAAQLYELREAYDRLGFQLGLALSDLEDRQNQLRANQRRIEELEAQLGIPSTSQKNPDLLEKLTLLEKSNQNLQEKVNDLSLTLGIAQSKIDVLDLEIAAKQKRIAELEQEVSGSKRKSSVGQSSPGSSIQSEPQVNHAVRNAMLFLGSGLTIGFLAHFIPSYLMNHSMQSLHDNYEQVVRERDELLRMNQELRDEVTREQE